MLTLQVELDARGYPIHIGRNLLGRAEHYAAFAGRPLRVLTDDNVAPHYLAAVLQALKLDADQARVLPAGEAQKNLAVVESVLDGLLQANFPRDGVLVALGGGVIGDLAGFVAAIYQRGIDFLQIPTTLLAQVDSSVGGKTGVNHARGKNLIGAFHQPRLVLADTDTLATLPPREFAAGLAEVIKYGLLGDAAFFAWLERNLERLQALEPEPLAQAIERCCAQKARIVGLDERESGPRALLNLGHTFAHAIETWSGYGSWLHGEAVATGLCMAADLSARMDWLAADDVMRCEALVARAGLPTRPPAGMAPADFIELMARDKKVAGGKLRLVLMRALGDAVLTADFKPTALDATLAQFCAEAV